MVTMKRKISTEKDKYGGFNSVIEIDEVKGKSYNTNQRERAEGVNYTKRDAFAKKGEVMPKINTQTNSKTASEELSTKTKILLFIYLVTAITLAAIVIGTGIAISSASNRVDALESQIQAQSEIILDQQQALILLNDENAILGKAVNEINMEKYDSSDVITIPLVETVEPTTYPLTNSIFNNICRFISSIFA